MKRLRAYILEQAAAGRIPKDEAAALLAELIKGQREPPPADRAADIAIIGMACRFPPGNDLEGFWDALAAGADLIGPFPEARRRDIDDLRRRLAERSPGDAAGLAGAYFEAAYLDRIDLFDAALFKIAPGEARLIDPQQRIMLEVALECMANAGYRRERMAGTRTGVYMAYADPDYERLTPPDEPSAVHATLPAMIAGRISYMFNLLGPSQVVETTCSSSLVAVHNACQALIGGDCDLALAGGVRLILFPFASSHAGSQQLGISSDDGRTRTFDAAGSGTGSGEGAGAVLLKPLARALADGDYIHAVIKGSAVNSDGRSSGVTAPNPDAQARVIAEAWRRARIDPQTIGYIEAHGTATKLGDPIEIEGISGAFRPHTDRAGFCAIGSVKTNMGHLSGAAGIAGLIKAALAIEHRQIPPSLHFHTPNPLINFAAAPVFVNDRLRDWDAPPGPRRAGVSAFGVTGTNCHVVLEEYAAPERAPEPGDQERLFTLSAARRGGLADLAGRYARALAAPSAQRYPLSAICYTANAGRDLFPHRLAIVARSVADLREKLAHAADLLRGEADPPAGGPIFYGVAEGQDEAGGSAPIDARTPPAALAERFVRAPRIPWDAYYAGQAAARVPLPAYAFEGQRCWVAPEQALQAAQSQLRMGEGRALGAGRAPAQADPPVESARARWLYTLRWREQPLADAAGGAGMSRGAWLILADALGIGDALAGRIGDRGGVAVRVAPGRAFRRVDDQRYQLDPVAPDDWRRLFADLGRAGQPLAGVIHLWTCTEDPPPGAPPQLDAGAFGMFAMLRQVVDLPVLKPFEIWIASSYATDAGGPGDPLHPEKAALWGLSKVIPQEYYWAQCYCIDIGGDAGERAAERILAEMRQDLGGREYAVAYRGAARMVPQVERLDLAALPDRPRPVVRTGGVYLLAGGAGRIGMGIARYLAQQARVTLALVNRSALPPRSQWGEIIAAARPGDPVARRLADIAAIERMGAEVVYIAADIGDRAAIERVVADLMGRYGRIDGVINATMAVTRKKIADLSQAEFEGALLNRIRGAQSLDAATRGAALDFFIIISSVSSIFGGAAQADDVAANMFLDAYGAWMNRCGRAASVLNLPGVQQSRAAPASIAEQVLPPISADELAELFDMLLGKRTEFVFIEDFDFRAITPMLPVLRARFAPALLAEDPPAPRAARREAASAPGSARLSGRGRDGSYSEAERRIAEVWLEVLGYAEIGVDDNFFDLGGDSLMAIRVLQGIRAALDADLDITDIFEHPTIAELAGRVAARAGAPASPLLAAPPPGGDPQPPRPAAIPRDERLALSFAQQQLWFLEQIEPGDPVNNIAVALRIAGRLDAPLFVRGIRAIIRRHEILRTTFAVMDDQPVQVIAPAPRLDARFADLRAISASARMEQAQRLALDLALQPFDLARGPLLRATLMRLGEREHVIALVVHHIVFDGVSMGLFMQELAAFYQAFAAGRLADPPDLPIQYADFALRQRQSVQGQAFEEQIAYWKKRLDGAAAIELPTDYPRPAALSFQGGGRPLAIAPDLAQALRALSQREGVTLFMTLLAAYLALIQLYAGRADLTIGAFSAQRRTPETRRLIGLFVNTLILRVDLSGRPPFREALARVRDVTLEASARQDLTFEQILEVVRPQREFGRVPLIRVVMDFHANPLQDVRFDGLEITPIGIDKRTARYDLNLELTDKGDAGLSGQFEYNAHLFKPDTVARMARQFETFLRNIAAQPDLRI